jgi:hypothetical protein
MDPRAILAVLLTGFCLVFAWGSGAIAQGSRLTILYSADERGEITPCG